MFIPNFKYLFFYLYLSIDDFIYIENRQGSTATKTFVVGDLVWGPIKNCPSWPGKISEVHDGTVTVKWFGTEKFKSKIANSLLQTLSEGLDTQHQSRKKTRT